MMDPFTIQTFLGGSNVSNALASAHASTLGGGIGGSGIGSMADKAGSQAFSFTTTQPFGTSIASTGSIYSLRPDFVTKILPGKSWSVFKNGQPLGWVGASNPTNGPFGSFASGGNLGPRLQSGLLSVLASTGQGV